MTTEPILVRTKLYYATENLKAAQTVAAQEGFEFLAYLIAMALKEADDLLRSSSGSETHNVVNLKRD
jgi:hypothetical protein